MVLDSDTHIQTAEQRDGWTDKKTAQGTDE